MSAAELRDLRDLLESLPQELYDSIVKLTFTDEPESITKLTRAYKPPAIMQVSRATRAMAARSHYATTIWVAEDELYRVWFASIDPAHDEYLEEKDYDAEAPGVHKNVIQWYYSGDIASAKPWSRAQQRWMRVKFGLWASERRAMEEAECIVRTGTAWSPKKERLTEQAGGE
ncbi:hypothetical protein CKM354_000086200 [Cercospora kikuchii]|uniref:Uncharacterized protein n=1 Tax=Cercospora kikuchii TaxID=84275 RepID=A0A9P3C9Q5_9PEZI|nr:uncharacterized protein CKM354_000086200 [Cercospora kikuchii]GIZ37416.1 hypothetical protein CKM354_000086200 [Cercospora kikuchii]